MPHADQTSPGSVSVTPALSVMVHFRVTTFVTPTTAGATQMPPVSWTQEQRLCVPASLGSQGMGTPVPWWTSASWSVQVTVSTVWLGMWSTAPAIQGLFCWRAFAYKVSLTVKSVSTTVL